MEVNISLKNKYNKNIIWFVETLLSNRRLWANFIVISNLFELWVIKPLFGLLDLQICDLSEDIFWIKIRRFWNISENVDNIQGLIKTNRYLSLNAWNTDRKRLRAYIKVDLKTCKKSKE